MPEEMNEEGQKLKCKNPVCVKSNKGKPYTWLYKGNSKGRFTSCPLCHGSVKKKMPKDAPAQKT